MELAVDTSKITIFDADTGANLTIAPRGSNGQSPEAPPAPETLSVPPPVPETPAAVPPPGEQSPPPSPPAE
jgi:hypothetical protein